VLCSLQISDLHNSPNLTNTSTASKFLFNENEPWRSENHLKCPGHVAHLVKPAQQYSQANRAHVLEICMSHMTTMFSSIDIQVVAAEALPIFCLQTWISPFVQQGLQLPNFCFS